MVTSARLLAETCTCGAMDKCVCSTRPFGDNGRRVEAGADKPKRQVLVSDKAFKLFERIGLTPPDEGPFDIRELDRRLESLDHDTRMEVKSHLHTCGLLPGRPI